MQLSPVSQFATTTIGEYHAVEPQTPYEIAVERLYRAIAEQTAYYSTERKADLLALLTELRVNTRLYYLSVDMAKSVIWPAIRETQTLLDSLVDICVDWRTNMSAHDYDDLCVFLARAIASVSSAQVTDNEFVSKISDQDSLYRLLLNEGWLTVLYLMVRNLSYLEALFIDAPPATNPR